ncbi:YihY/virulence factor BrkB family protein [Leptospira sp. GIMC2001]|uniref:YihY/virulence factor BrkB family protein n=1 Tax=Leptospira sp. GIMC2001 TaxID=1513297 RepID=UPI0023498317|nr:YihY/virulence factor BrkB family protein [Leptospira sp. GIMC2001]WCL50228.1 YihY/virulence factor BrkB family protein [Leptospira sp. GIMC2001]
MKKIIRFIQLIRVTDIHGLASEVSFTFLITLFPLIVVFVSLLSIFQDSKTINLLTEQVGKILPDPIFLPIEKSVANLTKIKSFKAFALSLIFSIFTGFTIFASVSKSIRKIYGLKESVPLYKSILVSMKLFAISAIIFIILSYLIYGMYTMEGFLFKKWKFTYLRKNPEFFIAPVSLIFLSFLFATIYRLASHKKIPWKFHWFGGILASMLWVPVSLGFQWYLQFKNLTVNYSYAYDLISKMVVLMLYTYLSFTFFLWGAVWNRVGFERKRFPLKYAPKS